MPQSDNSAAVSELEQQASLIAALQRPEVFPHTVGEIKLLETHISWVLLTGEFVYKIKKAVDFGFLDFSSLEKRKRFCEREVELNSQYSEGIYLEVVKICGTLDRPHLEKPELDGNGEAIEYAVKMRQFPEGKLFSELADDHRLQTKQINALAARLVEVHAEAETVRASSARLIEKACLGNIRALSWPPVNEANDLALVESLGIWTLDKLDSMHPIFKQREREGRVKLCHGDLHLANITLIDDKPVFFDCIEFNDDLRTVDTQSELAFLLMDLECRQQAALANSLLNRYLQLSGDYAGLAVLNFYKVYRALVRAKVNYLQARQDKAFQERTHHQLSYLKYLGLAKSYMHTRSPRIVITCGVSGSGKSTQALRFATENNAIHISSDIERKRLFGLQEHESSHSQIAQGIYSTEATQRTYARLLELAEQIVNAGFCVIVDASFLKCSQRQLFLQFASERKLAFQILHCTAPRAELEKRVRERQSCNDSASEAGLEVLAMQLQSQEALTDFEKQYVLKHNKLA